MDSIKKAALELRVAVEAEDITLEVMAEVMRVYKKKYGYVPIQWTKQYRVKYAINKYKTRLIELGYEHEAIADMDVYELRDECESHEYKETITMTTNGVTRRRVA